MTFNGAFILGVLRGTPWWAWALLAFLVYRGVVAMRGGVTSFGRLAIIPVLFTVWGLASIIDLFHVSGLSVGLWFSSFIVGFGGGYWLGSLRRIRADHTRKRIELAGSPLALVLILLIFIVKYTLGVMLAINPAARDTLWFLLVDCCVSGVVAGMFAGRLCNYWHQYKREPQTDLMTV